MKLLTKVGIIIVDFHGDKNTRECLDSLAKAKGDFQVYLVLPDSSESTLESHSTKPILLKRTENLGFAWANNLGMKQAFKDGCQSVILLNNDTTVGENFLKPILMQLEHNEVGLVCPLIYFYPGKEFHQSEYQDSERGRVIWYAGGVIDWKNVFAYHWAVDEVDHGQFIKPTETDFATGCCLGVTKETVDRIGFMDESYFLYFEDVDWSMRAKRMGLKVVIEPKSVIWHKNAGSTGGSGSELQKDSQSKSRYRFAMKYASLRTKLAVVRERFKWLNSAQS